MEMEWGITLLPTFKGTQGCRERERDLGIYMCMCTCMCMCMCVYAWPSPPPCSNQTVIHL